MNNREKIEEEISRHLNAAGSYYRKKVERDQEYQAALKSGNMEKALEVAYGIIYGNANTKSEHTRLKEIKNNTDNLLEL
jgi:hypothetical protein